jgi:hypothetical protein
MFGLSRLPFVWLVVHVLFMLFVFIYAYWCPWCSCRLTVTRRMPFVEQELLTLPKHMWGSCCSIFSFLCSVLYVIVCPFVLFLFGHSIVSFDLRLLITLWYLLAIVLSIPSIYGYWLPFGIFWPLYCLSFDLQLLITPWYISSGHCIVCPSICGYWLPFGILDLQLLITLWYLLAIALSILWFTATDYPLVSSGHCIVCPSIYGYWLPFGILDLQLLITLWYLRFTTTAYPLVSSGHCIVCPLIYGYWLPFGIFWPLYCLTFDLQLLIILWYLLAIVLSVLWFTATDYPLVS